MPIMDLPEESPQPQHALLKKTQSLLRKGPSNLRLSVSAQATNVREAVAPSPKFLKRDILYRAIDQFELSGDKMSQFTSLMARLSLDLGPLESGGEQWYSCVGKTEDGCGCRRLIPELYMRTAVGKLLQSFMDISLRGDHLTEELSTALAYAICSEHHQRIHKITRALECQRTIEQWRTKQLSEDIRRSPPRVELPQEGAIGRKSAPEQEKSGEIPILSPAATAVDFSFANGESDDEDEESERLAVEREYQDYLRDTRREGRSGSESSSHKSSADPLSESRSKVLRQLRT